MTPWRIPLALFRVLLPPAEREEIIAELEAEYRERSATHGAITGAAWLWGQLIRSFPSLARRTWQRGHTGFDAHANVMNPGGPIMERWMLDARYAARRLRTRPTYTIFAVVTLALGVGGMATISGIVRPLLVHPLPYPNDRELAQFWHPGDWNAKEVVATRHQWSDFTAVAAYHPKDLTLEQRGAPTRLLPGIASSSELFQVLGVRPAIGRGFATGEDAPGAARVVVLSDRLWRELGGDPAIVGSTVTLDGLSRTVVGVMPRGFWFPDPGIEVWIPDEIDPKSGVGLYTLVGRVAPGHRIDRMQPALDRVTRLLGSLFTYSPEWDLTKNAKLTPLRDALVGGMRPAVFAMLAGLTIILLIACANVAALFLGQVEGRASELAVRAALGADRGRLVTQLMIEVLMLGIVAGFLGIGMAVVGFDGLRGALPLGAWRDSATVDWTLGAITMVLAIGSAIAISLFPALALWRGDLRGTLSEGRAASGSPRRGGLQGAIIIGEVTLAVLLACGAGLLTRSVTKLYAIRPGFETRGVAVLDLAIPTNIGTAQRHEMVRAIVSAISQLPGVRSAAATQRLPLRGHDWTMGMRLPGALAGLPSPFFRMVTRDYFATLGIPVVRGRGFDGSDRATDSVVSIVINERLAAMYFPNVEPIGRVILGGFGPRERIVGVVGDAAEGTLTEPRAPVRYYLSDQISFVPDGQTIMVSLSSPGSTEQFLPAARGLVERLAPMVAVQNATTMDRVVDTAVGPARRILGLVGVLATLALVLGSIGIYGVVAQFVGRRRREWSIRLALGLTPAQVMRRVVFHGLAFVATGLILGTAASLVLARFLSSLLYDVTPADPLVLGATVCVTLAVGTAAAFVPALRAATSDPALVLREQ